MGGRRVGGVLHERLFESANGAALVSREPGSPVPCAIARAGLTSWRAANFSGDWGVLGPRATTEAWVGRAGSLGPSFRLFAPETFGFVTCGRRSISRWRGEGAASGGGAEPTAGGGEARGGEAASGGGDTATARVTEEACASFSSSDLPVDEPSTSDEEWRLFTLHRVSAQLAQRS